MFEGSDEEENVTDSSVSEESTDSSFSTPCSSEPATEQAQECSEIQVENEDDNDLPIFPTCPISVNVSMILCLLFISRHKMTQEAAEDLILLILPHIPSEYKPKMSLYLLRKHFNTYFNEPKPKARAVLSFAAATIKDVEISLALKIMPMSSNSMNLTPGEDYKDYFQVY